MVGAMGHPCPLVPITANPVESIDDGGTRMGTLRWPDTVPSPVRTKLEQLHDRGALSGVPPEVLACICRFTSNYGQPSLAVNPQGFGGFFGQHATWRYPNGQVFTVAQLIDPSCFTLQAITAAVTLVSYHLDLASSLTMYAGGHVIGWRSTGLATYVISTTGATPAMRFAATPIPSHVRRTSMGVTINDGYLAVEGVTTTGHKVVGTVLLATRANAKQWSFMDVTDAMKLQGMSTVQFTD